MTADASTTGGRSDRSDRSDVRDVLVVRNVRIVQGVKLGTAAVDVDVQAALEIAIVRPRHLGTRCDEGGHEDP